MISATSTIRTLGSRFGKRVTRIELFDANACAWSRDASTPWKTHVTQGEPLSLQLRLVLRNRKVRVSANANNLTIEVKGNLAVEPLSINRPDRNWSLFASQESRRQLIGTRSYSVFTRRGIWSDRQVALVQQPTLSAMLDEAELGETEALHVDGGRLELFLERPSPDRVLRLADRAVSLIEQAEVPVEEERFQRLPAMFRPIIPLIQKWTISDDGERSEVLAEASKMTLGALVKEAEPYLTSIDSYLASFADSQLPEEAAALGRFAELVAEARHEIAAGRR